MSAVKKTASPIGGIYFVVPFPSGWEVCAFRFGIYPDVGHAQTWDLLVAPQLAMRWASTLYSAQALDRIPDLIDRLAHELAGLYDATPRGRALTLPDRRGKCHIYHGDDLAAWMRITKRKIEIGLGLTSNLVWVYDEHETRNPDSTDRLQRLLNLPRDGCQARTKVESAGTRCVVPRLPDCSEIRDQAVSR